MISNSDTQVARLRSEIAEYEETIAQMETLFVQLRHEINDPLSALLGQTQLLLGEELAQKVRERVSKIEMLAIRIADVLATLRDIQANSEKAQAAEFSLQSPSS